MRHRLISLGLALFSGSAGAQGPLTIEQLLVDASRWQFVSGYDFRSATTSTGATAESTGWNAAIRYGVSNRLELSARLGVQDLRIGSGLASAEQGVENISIGTNWLVHRESAFPALMVELNAEFNDDSNDGEPDFAATRWALTSYRTVDPLVISVTLAGRHEQPTERGGMRIQGGDSYLANARVNFAVNPRVTLFGGISLQWQSATDVDGQKQPRPVGSAGLNGGFAYAVSARHTVFLDADIAPQANGAGASLRWFMEF